MLYVVSTPIGNLEDITLRAITVLRSVDVILAEDTRITRVLLEKYNIKKSLISYHQHSQIRKIESIINYLKEGKKLALVSDAGTPGINDPGNYLISQILEQIPECRIVPIPGPNAAIAALSVSGFSCDNFSYLGFPPHKKGRQTFFKELGNIDSTIVFYESKYRIIKAMEELRKYSEIGKRKIIVARELTKQFESVYRGTAEQVLIKLNSHKDNLLGEFVVIINKK